MTDHSVSQAGKKPRFFYGYIIVAAAFVIMAITAGALFSYGIFVKPLAEEFSWSRAAISGAHSLSLLLTGLLFIVTGRLTDKFGTRLMVTICGLFTGMGYLLISQVHALWQLYLAYGVVCAIGQSGTLVPMMSTVARWFVKRRGMMTGIMLAGTGVGQIITPAFASRLISAHGWRTAYMAIGIIALALVIGTAQLLRKDPSQVGQLPDGAREVRREALVPASSGFTRRQAVHTRQFWMLCLIYLCSGLFLQTIMVHIVPYATDLGILAITASSIISVFGALNATGRIGMGIAGDRIGNRRGLIIVLILIVFASVWLQLANQLWMLYLFAVVFGFAYGGILALESPTVAELFGLKSHGTILGLIHPWNTIGGAISPFLAGWLFDITGSYQLPFRLCILAGGVGLMMAVLINIAPRPRTGGLPSKPSPTWQ